MARARMATAVEPPPQYFSATDICHVQHTSAGYSKQVMPPPFVGYDRPEMPTDDTMILLDVSGSMDFEPSRPNYNQYLITGYSKTTQPKNKGKTQRDGCRRMCFLIGYRCGQVHHSTLHRCHVKPRPRIPRIRSHHLLESGQLYRHGQSPEFRLSVENRQNWGRNPSNDRLAKSKRFAFPKAFRICNTPSNIRMASRAGDAHATIAAVA